MDNVAYKPAFWAGQTVVTKGGRTGIIVGQKTMYEGRTPHHVYFLVYDGNKSRTTVEQSSIDKIYKQRKKPLKN